MEFELKEAVIEITKKCNLKCVHCGSGCTGESDEELSIPEWKKVISGLADTTRAEKVVFSGGEPTMKQGIEELFDHVTRLGMRYGIITNGLVTERIVEILAGHKPFAVGFSVDGLKETHNKIRRNEQSWNKCMESISRVKEFGLPVCIVTTLNRWNWKELEDLMSLVAFLGIDSWQLQLTFPTGRAKEQENFLIDQAIFDQIFKKIEGFRKEQSKVKIEAADCFAFAMENLIREEKWLGCQAGITSIGIDAQGNVMPCLAMREAAFCGNLKRTPIKLIWETSEKLDFNRNFNPNTIEGECRECEILELCRGGCASFSLAYNGRFHDAPFCHFRKELKKGGN